MAYRKFRADQLFDGHQFVDEVVLIADEEDGRIEAIVPPGDAGGNIESFEGILCPGFINCHCHLELSHMKGLIPESTGLVPFVVGVVQQRHFPDEEIGEAIEQAEDEMLRNGIVAVGDICNNTLTIPQKNKGQLFYHNFIEASGYPPSIAQSRFERSRDFFAAYARFYSIPIASNSIVPHAPYSVSDELWELLLQFPGNQLFTIHNQETKAENEWFLEKQGGLAELYDKLQIDTSFYRPSGKSSLQTYLPKFLPNQQVILVHNVHTSESDILFAKTTNAGSRLFWCLCVNANQYIGGQLPDIELLMKQGCTIVLGTDSLASNHQLSILEEIQTIQRNFPGIEKQTLLQWATINGARALQMEAVLGSFEKDKQPGILLLDEELKRVERLL